MKLKCGIQTIEEVRFGDIKEHPTIFQSVGGDIYISSSETKEISRITLDRCWMCISVKHGHVGWFGRKDKIVRIIRAQLVEETQ